MSETLNSAATVLAGLAGVVGLVRAVSAFWNWLSIRRQRAYAGRPSVDQFYEACHREFRYLMKKYGFAAEPLVLPDSGIQDPFGCRFRGPKLSVAVQGINWGFGLNVYFQTRDQEAEWAAEFESPWSANSGDDSAVDMATWRKRYHELLMRTQLQVDWLLDQRVPGWRSRGSEDKQLALIHDYAAGLRRCADDLFSGDLRALPELLTSYADHWRQQDIRDRREGAIEMARIIAQEAERPKTLLEQAKIVQGTQTSIGYLRTECRVLLKALGKSPEARPLLGFVESWRALVERLEAEIVAFAHVQNLDVSSRIVEELRNAQGTAIIVQSALASGESNDTVKEMVATLDHQGKELTLALDCGMEALSRK